MKIQRFVKDKKSLAFCFADPAGRANNLSPDVSQDQDPEGERRYFHCRLSRMGQWSLTPPMYLGPEYVR